MRAATIRDGSIAVEEHPDPVPGRLRPARPRPRRRAQRRRHACSSRAATRRRPARRRTSPGSSWPARSSSAARACSASSRATASCRSSPAAARPSSRSCTSARRCRCPRSSSWDAAGGVPEVFTTAHDALFTQAGLRLGERLLVHGAAGGVGMAAVQLGQMAGARVTATVRNPDHRARIDALDVQAIEPEGFEEHGPFDVILELVGAPNLPGNVAALADRRPDRGDRHRRRRQGRARPARADGQARAHPRLDAARPPARGQGRHRALRRARGAARLRLRRPERAGRARPIRSTRSRTPTSASRPAPSSARSCCCPSAATARRPARRARATSARWTLQRLGPPALQRELDLALASARRRTPRSARPTDSSVCSSRSMA